jgi:hypothetical protein
MVHAVASTATNGKQSTYARVGLGAGASSSWGWAWVTRGGVEAGTGARGWACERGGV